MEQLWKWKPSSQSWSAFDCQLHFKRFVYKRFFTNKVKLQLVLFFLNNKGSGSQTPNLTLTINDQPWNSYLYNGQVRPISSNRFVYKIFLQIKSQLFVYYLYSILLSSIGMEKKSLKEKFLQLMTECSTVEL